MLVLIAPPEDLNDHKLPQDVDNVIIKLEQVSIKPRHVSNAVANQRGELFILGDSNGGQVGIHEQDQIRKHLETEREGESGQNQSEVEQVLVDLRHRHLVVIEVALFFPHHAANFASYYLENAEEREAKHRLNQPGRRVAHYDLLSQHPLEPLVLLRIFFLYFLLPLVGIKEHGEHKHEVDEHAA